MQQTRENYFYVFHGLLTVFLSLPSFAFEFSNHKTSIVYDIPVEKGGGFAEIKIYKEGTKYNLLLELRERNGDSSKLVLQTQISDLVDIIAGPRGATLELHQEVIDGKGTESFFINLLREDGYFTDRIRFKYSLRKDRSGWDLAWVARTFLNPNSDEAKSCIVNFVGKSFVRFQPEVNQMSAPQMFDLSGFTVSRATFSIIKKLEEKKICRNTLDNPMQKTGSVAGNLALGSAHVRLFLEDIDASCDLQSPL